MKTSGIILIVLSFCLFSCAKNPPAKVSESFSKKFPGAIKVSWGQEKSSEWEAEFKMNGVEMSACFDPSGNWMETEKEIGQKELPAKILAAISQKYAGYKIEETVEIENNTFKGYEIALKLKKEEIEVLATSEGELTLKKESEEK